MEKPHNATKELIKSIAAGNIEKLKVEYSISQGIIIELNTFYDALKFSSSVEQFGHIEARIGDPLKTFLENIENNRPAH
jgi:hypothetical protein